MSEPTAPTTSSEFTQFWRNNTLLKWSNENTVGRGLRPTTCDFLMTVGLPNGIDWTLGFESSGNLVGKRYFLIGNDAETPIGIDTANEDAIVFLPNMTPMLTNTSVLKFAQCLVLFQQYRLAARQTAESEIDALVSATERQMWKVDEVAMSNSANYWPVVVEQMHDGLL